MINIQDLQLHKEVLPKFDYSLHTFTHEKLQELLQSPLSSITAILERQEILKGFIANHSALENYTYPISYLQNTYTFLLDQSLVHLPKNSLKYTLLVSKHDRSTLQSKCAQLILLFHQLENSYFSQLRLKVFPTIYAEEVRSIIQFLRHFQLERFAKFIRENKFRDGQTLEFIQLIIQIQKKHSIQHFWDCLFLFEAYHSIAMGIDHHNYVFPTFTEHAIDLKGFYHPMLPKPIANDFCTSSSVILLNGPNMSGKSTFLKAVSLCVYLGHLGIGIPAQEGAIPFFSSFSIAINHRDDLLNGYSHFMNEIVNLKSVVQEVQKSDSCFAVFDELFSGTNVEDATEICKTTIQGLSKHKKSFFFISTHIQQLEALQAENIEAYYIDCELINNIPTFTYQIKKGWSKLKIGRIIFEQEGLYKLLIG